MTQTVQETTQRADKWNLTKLKSSSVTKDTIRREETADTLQSMRKSLPTIYQSDREI